jgi:hypothetical protein
MTRRLAAFGAFWYDFVVGDDWRLAVGVVIALGLTAILASASVAAWWATPVVVVVLLVVSVTRAGRPPR